DYFFQGMIDDVRIYNRALSAEEAAGLAGVTTPLHKPF
ncbi:MAG: LamG domain-containing protein, partial [Planctomycetes bacterium]|nr:LamG domain-containing protein [Planctomycetota bacterium]